MRWCTARSMLALALATSAWGCKSPDKSQAAPAASSTGPTGGGGVQAASTARPAVASSEPPPASTVQLPEGPVLAIQAGQGVGPIRIGATVATIERLMGAPCEVKTASVCRYIKRAVEFELDKNGVTERIVVHRHDRPAGPDAKGEPQVYGFFNGAIPPGVGLGMIPKAVLEMLGPPASSERVTTANDFNTVDRDTYPNGMVLEYDEYKKSNRVLLGGVIITKPPK
ncbi:MAG TPA: hypothetical protein VER11_01885 [Polyangiaceae bacterium]|nr:hypothetical protein [Polyangiaceae bacterium]